MILSVICCTLGWTQLLKVHRPCLQLAYSHWLHKTSKWVFTVQSSKLCKSHWQQESRGLRSVKKGQQTFGWSKRGTLQATKYAESRKRNQESQVDSYLECRQEKFEFNIRWEDCLKPKLLLQKISWAPSCSSSFSIVSLLEAIPPIGL